MIHLITRASQIFLSARTNSKDEKVYLFLILEADDIGMIPESC